MSGISTGIGLISGIDTASLIDQLIAIDRRPVETLQQRVTSIDAQKTAFLSISAQLLAVRNAVSNMESRSFFRRFSSASSNESILTATASDKASPGSYTFSVRSLVSNHSMLSRGFADANESPIGVGKVSIEVGKGQVNQSTMLDELRGGDGVRRGVITITDRDGNSADIDLRSAVNMRDIIDAINTEAGINVHAYTTSQPDGTAQGDRLVIEDKSSAGATGTLSILDKNGGRMAHDLGIAGSADLLSPDRINGVDLIYLSSSTSLSRLNDGNGVGKLFDGSDLIFESGSGAFDFEVSLSDVLASRLDTPLAQLNSGHGVRPGKIQITDRAGNSAVIDLSDEDPNRPAVNSIGDVIQRINEDAEAAGLNVTATVVNASLLIADNSGPDGEVEGALPLIIEDLPDANGNPGSTAADLGIAGSVEDNSVTGRDLYRIETVGDLVNAINNAIGNLAVVEASISEDGNSIVFQSTGMETFTIRAGEGSTAAADLGIEDLTIDALSTANTKTLVGGLDTVLLDTLNGGSGVTLGQMSLTNRAGQSTGAIDFTSARTLQDVIDIINSNAPTNANGERTITAAVNPTGTGIVIRDTSGGTGSFEIADVSGSLGADLGIAVSVDEDEISSGNLQRQYVSRQTLLDDLNSGVGVSLGAFQIIDSTGFTHRVSVPGNATNVGDVIDAINRSTPDTIEARINDNGDGIVVVDTSTGSEQMKIEDLNGGTTAANLRLAGEAKGAQNYIDGSYEITVDLAAGDTLNDLVSKLNDAGGQFTASLVNDGGSVNPYSLTIASDISGMRGQLVIDSSGIDLGLNTLSRAADAVVAVGGDDAENPILITSSTNTLDSAIEGVSLDLLSVGDEAVTVDIAHDIDAVVDSVRTFIDAYNETQGVMDELTDVDTETFERGVLQGDRTIDTIRGRLYRAVSRPVAGVAREFSHLFNVGITIGSANRLDFDEEKFRAAYEDNPERVEALFTNEETGFGHLIQNALEEITNDFDGVIAERNNLLDDRQGLLNDRIDDLNILLDAKRARLEAEFVAMERALADLQGQQNALNQLAGLIPA